MGGGRRSPGREFAVTHEEPTDLAAFLAGGRKMIEQAAEMYGRPLSPEEYWWLGVGLAALTLADLSDKPYAAGRIEQLIDRLGYKGIKDDWLQRFVEELAELNAEGLLWPLYQREGNSPVMPTGAAVHPSFGAEAAYFLSLAHIGVALAVHREDEERVGRLASVVLELVEGGLDASHEPIILEALRPLAEQGDA
jgi:hypothetical protein